MDGRTDSSLSQVRVHAWNLIGLTILLVHLNESMRELERVRDKPELSVAALLALIHAHKQHKTPGACTTPLLS